MKPEDDKQGQGTEAETSTETSTETTTTETEKAPETANEGDAGEGQTGEVAADAEGAKEADGAAE